MIDSPFFRRLCLAASVAALLSCPASGVWAMEGSGKSMTLRDAVGTGVMTNPEYGIVASSRRATDEELNQARGLYLPSIDFRGDTGYEYSDDAGTRARGAATGGDDTQSLWRNEAGLTLTQMLFDGWKAK